ncbi:hypothetical protein EGW08_017780, partial [Elysia chlorotica]
ALHCGTRSWPPVSPWVQPYWSSHLTLTQFSPPGSALWYKVLAACFSVGPALLVITLNTNPILTPRLCAVVQGPGRLFLRGSSPTGHRVHHGPGDLLGQVHTGQAHAAGRAVRVSGPAGGAELHCQLQVRQLILRPGDRLHHLLPARRPQHHPGAGSAGAGVRAETHGESNPRALYDICQHTQ